MAEESETLPAGTTLAHYRIERAIGSGAMGTVYLAQDTALERPVAVKVLRPEVARRPEIVSRFAREARAAARVNHPNLTHIYFVGEHDGGPFFAMEHVPGTTVEDRVRTRGPLDLGEAVDVLAQAARGLAAAHRAGVVHRDVKPSNLLLAPDGSVKVTDFGIARSLDGDVEKTAAGAVLGTPQYMSPEQCRGGESGPASDVYCLGLVGWFLLAGRAPYAGTSLGEVLHDQMSSPLPPLDGARPGLPAGVEKLLGRMTAKAPGDRPPTMDEVVTRLEELRPRPLLLAPLGARAAAAAIDLVLVFGVLGFLLALARYAILDPQHLDKHTIRLGFEIGGSIALWLLSAAWFLGFEAWWGATPGKRFLRLAVVREDGGRAPLRAHALRYLIRWPSLALFLPVEWDDLYRALEITQVVAVLGAIVCAIVKGRTLSDLATKTRVVVGARPEARRPSAGAAAAA